MSDLGPLLKQVLDSIEPPPDGFRRLAERRRRRHRNQRVGAAAVALVVAAGGFAIAARALLSSDPVRQPVEPAEGLPSSKRTGPVDPQVTARIEVGDLPLRAAVGEGAVWVATHPEGPSELVKVDPRSNSVVGQMLFQGRVQVTGLAAGGGSVWAVLVRDGRHVLARVDPQSLEETHAFGIEYRGVFASVAAGPEGAWAVTRTMEDSPPSLLRIDPETVEANPMSLQGVTGSVLGLALAESQVWLRTSEETDGAEGCARLVHVDPTTNDIVEDVVVPGPAQAGTGGLRVVGGAGGVWVNCREHREKLFVVGVDTHTGEETARFSLPGGVFWPIGASADGVWLAGFDTEERPLIVLIDPDSGEVLSSLNTQTSFIESAVYDPALDAIWVPDSRRGADSILRIDVRP